MVNRAGICARTGPEDQCQERVMAQHQTKTASALAKVDPVWAQIRQEAEEVVRREPELTTFIFSTVLHHDTLEAAVIHRVSERLERPDVSAELIRQAYGD